MKRIIFSLFILFACFKSEAAYTHWVFEGAGIRGIAYVGAIKELDKLHYLDSLQVVGGTSAGSITACFLALGFTPQEMETELRQLNFRKFNDNTLPLVSGLRNMIKHFGWYKGDAFEKWNRKLIASKTNNPNITFKELHDNPNYKDLYIMGASINNQRSINFNYKTYPNMEIATAVRVSMSIPYYYKAVIIDSNGKRLKEQPIQGAYDICVDGGMTSNLPVELFNTPQENILGFQIVRDEQLKYDSQKRTAPFSNMKSIGTFVKAIYNLTKENSQNLKLANYKKVKLVNISDGNVGPRIRKLRKETVDLLLENGRSAILSNF
jgi:NTE family protein